MTASIAQQKIRIRLKAFDRRMLDLSATKLSKLLIILLLQQ